IPLPALQDGMRCCQMLKEPRLPLFRANRPLAGVLPQHRTAIQSQILSQRRIRMLGQHVAVLRIKVQPARRQQHIETELPLTAGVETLAEDIVRLASIATAEE